MRLTECRAETRSGDKTPSQSPEALFNSEEKAYSYYMNHNTSSDAVYGMGLIGAAVYFIQQADSFGTGIVGLLKAFIWPALLVYRFLAL